ncbi:HPr-rel-A system PqqD family peptide chaperone [Sphingomonas sp.]|jgi:PqqD family protein of HPr-rel-A system|uniref:HPr-rel-A system PqqD family peptide chaperone n=1 Tax=Sphingomonas sp. TaxID=28214 RepID=UPI002ED9755A
MRYRADTPALLIEPLDAFVAVFHRPSGATHLLVSPAPEILAILGQRPLTIDALLVRLSADYALIDADRAALSQRVEELVAAGLIEAI